MEETKPVMGRPTKYRPEYCAQLIEHMKQGGSYESFASLCKVAISTLYVWEEHFEDFSEAKKIGWAHAYRFYEDMAKMGMSGNLRRVVSEKPMVVKDKDGNETIARDAAGAIIYERTYAPSQFNALTWIFMVRNRFPTLYKDVRHMAISGDGQGGPISLKKVEPSAEEKLQQIIEVQKMLKEIENAEVVIGIEHKPNP